MRDHRFIRLGRLIRAGVFSGIATLAAALLLSACATTSLRDVVPPELADQARVAGLRDQNIRIWGDEAPKDFKKMAEVFARQRQATLAAAGKTRGTIRDDMLVISGGGSDGAFGAGLLNGWTAHGTRPKFVVVTGVSTGALMAPFAFLGPRYDPTLKEFYTSYSTKDILRPTVLAGLLGGNAALGSSEPLANLIKKYLTRSVMREIAAEHAKGRRLLVGTTNLDAERPVIWNMGAIATIGNDRALALMRKVLLASAAIPGVFPQ